MNQMDINEMRLSKMPMEPKNDPHIPVARDWLDKVIYSDDMDDYIEYEGDYILDEPEHIRAYLLENGAIKNTMEIYEEVLENG